MDNRCFLDLTKSVNINVASGQPPAPSLPPSIGFSYMGMLALWSILEITWSNPHILQVRKLSIVAQPVLAEQDPEFQTPNS